MSEDNVNGEASMKGTKNPGKLNTSFWDTAFKEDKENAPKPKPKAKKKAKKKKSKMASMWENKFEEQKKKVEATSYKKRKSTGGSKPSTGPSTPTTTTTFASASSTEQPSTISEANGAGDDAEAQNGSKPSTGPSTPTTTTTVTTTTTEPQANGAEDTSATTNDTEVNGSSPPTTSEPEPKPEEEPEAEAESESKPKGKVSALAGKLNINPMKMMGGGLPPSLKKKREEQKEQGIELPGQDFARPVIPASARRKATKKNIIDVTNEQINEALTDHLRESFKFDECMILSDDNLCAYLRDIADIDLSSTGDNKWEFDILTSAVKEVFGDEAKVSYGYALRAI